MEQSRAHQCMLNMKQQIIAISKEDKLANPVILISGFLLSLWTNGIFVVGLFPSGLEGMDLLLELMALATHLIISLFVSKGVYDGVQLNDPVYLKPWLYLKFAEGIFMFIGSILCSTNYHYYYSGLTSVGIILLMFGVYLTMYVYTTYKKMLRNVPAPDEHVTLPEQPPAYDSFANEKSLA